MRIADDVRAVVARIDRIVATADAFAFGELVRTAPASNAASQAPAAPRATIDALIAENASAFGVDPALVTAIAEAESGFDPSATSSAGAGGIMQLMPSTARSLGIADVYDPAENLRGGVRYLSGLLRRFGRVDLAVAAYNAGPAAVSRFDGVPPYPETQAYVRRVLARYRQLSIAAPPVLKPATLR